MVRVIAVSLEGFSEHMNHVLEMILARSDAGQLALAPVDVDAGDIARRALDPYQAVAADRGIALRFTGPGAAPLHADALWLGRAVANLVDNAVKFTPSGGAIHVSVTTREAHAAIEVEDSGPGIVDEDRARVFERFFRGRDARAATDGSGLGLALAREIVRASGGTLTLERVGQRWARFRIELPLRPRAG